MKYEPKPIDTAFIELSADILELSEKLSKNIHDVWAKQRMNEGWTYGNERNDQKKEHPCLIPYEQLPESEKEYDRKTTMESLKTIISLGYKIIKEE